MHPVHGDYYNNTNRLQLDLSDIQSSVRIGIHINRLYPVTCLCISPPRTPNLGIESPSEYFVILYDLKWEIVVHFVMISTAPQCLDAPMIAWLQKRQRFTYIPILCFPKHESFKVHLCHDFRNTKGFQLRMIEIIKNH